MRLSLLPRLQTHTYLYLKDINSVLIYSLLFFHLWILHLPSFRLDPRSLAHYLYQSVNAHLAKAELPLESTSLALVVFILSIWFQLSFCSILDCDLFVSLAKLPIIDCWTGQGEVTQCGQAQPHSSPHGT